MHLSTYLLLVGAAVLVTHFSGTDSYAIGSKKVEDHESSETSADNERVGAALNRTSSSEVSTEEEEEDDGAVEDSSEEEKDNQIVKRSAQFSRNSDEFDNFSFEIDNRRPVGGPVQQTAAQQPSTNVRNPVFRNSDERIDASDELRSVLASRASPVRPVVPTQTAFVNSDRLPLVPLSFRNLVRQQQQSDDFDDDISIEIRDRVAAVRPSFIQQQVVATRTVTAGRPPAPTGLRNPILVRQSDDDFDDVSLEIVRQVAPTPVRQVVATQTGLPNRLPVPMGFRTQLVRESDGDVSLEVVRDVTPNQPTVPSPINNNPAANIRTAVFSQSDERDDVSVEIFGSIFNPNAGQIPTAPPAAQQTSAIRPIQQANNRQQPIQTFNQVNNIPARPAVPARPQVQPAPVPARPQVQPAPVPARPQVQPAPVPARPQVQPAPAVRQVTPTQPAVASSNRLPLVPMSFRNPILVRQSDDFDDDISIEIRDQVRLAPATSVVQQVVATQTATSDRLPVPLSFRNPILRQSDDFDDVSIEIRDRNIFTAPQQVNRPAANGQAGALAVNANRPEFVVTQDADGDVSLELVSRVQQSQQPAGVENQSVQQGFSISPVRPLVPPQPVAAGSLVQTGNEGQRVNIFDDYSLEDNNDDDFFLEDQFDNVDGFRLLASDFFAQPSGSGFPVARSVENQQKTAKKDMQVEDNLADPISLADSDFHVPAESDDWFLVKQYMDHDYSSEELEGELAKEYFWQPVKDAKKIKTDEEKMAELKPARS